MKRKKMIYVVISLIVLVILLVAVSMQSLTENNHGIVDITNSMENGKYKEIETKYVNIKIPKDWSDKFRIKEVDQDNYTIQFYGILNNGKEVHLGDIIFGGDKGYTVGYYNTDENRIAVNIVYCDFEENESWEEDEKLEIQEMEYIIELTMDSISENEGFEFI